MPRAMSDEQVLASFKALIQPRSIATVAHRGIHRYAPENTRISYVQAIEAGAPALFNDIHEDWGEKVLPNSVGIGVLNWHNGFEWRQWYYSESWAECYGNISGLQYGDIWLE